MDRAQGNGIEGEVRRLRSTNVIDRCAFPRNGLVLRGNVIRFPSCCGVRETTWPTCTHACMRPRCPTSTGSLLLLVACCLVPFCLGLSTQGNAILDENGSPLTLRGATWFGFNNGFTMASQHGISSCSPPLHCPKLGRRPVEPRRCSHL